MSISAKKIRRRPGQAQDPYLRCLAWVPLTYNGRKTRDQISRQARRQYDALRLRDLVE
jgi:hypothetical protein